MLAVDHDEICCFFFFVSVKVRFEKQMIVHGYKIDVVEESAYRLNPEDKKYSVAENAVLCLFDAVQAAKAARFRWKKHGSWDVLKGVFSRIGTDKKDLGF